MLFLGSTEEELHAATPEEQGHLVFTALQRGFLKLDWKRCEAVITLLGGWRINPDSASAEVELMQCQPVFTGRREVEEQQEDRRQQTGSTGSWGGGAERMEEDGGVEEQKVQGGERGREAMAERLPPALSQPHAWLLLPLIVIAVQTRPTAATNISCLIWHTHVRSPMDTHTHTHTKQTDIARMSGCCPALWHPVILPSCVLLTDKSAAAVIALRSL